ncbi:hypothetical protein C8R43DRAFT_988028 [Mycena crocata]|nr:hypothetical protein C8R43DRAFT_988028 [Mycena crocata]
MDEGDSPSARRSGRRRRQGPSSATGSASRREPQSSPRTPRRAPASASASGSARAQICELFSVWFVIFERDISSVASPPPRNVHHASSTPPASEGESVDFPLSIIDSEVTRPWISPTKREKLEKEIKEREERKKRKFNRRAPGPDQEIWQINSDGEEPTLFTPVAKPARRNFLAGEVIELVSTDDEELTPTRPTKRKRQVDQKSRKRPRASSAEESDQGPLTRPATPPPFSDAEDLLLAGNHDMDDVGIVEPDPLHAPDTVEENMSTTEPEPDPLLHDPVDPIVDTEPRLEPENVDRDMPEDGEESAAARDVHGEPTEFDPHRIQLGQDWDRAFALRFTLMPQPESERPDTNPLPSDSSLPTPPPATPGIISQPLLESEHPDANRLPSGSSLPTPPPATPAIISQPLPARPSTPTSPLTVPSSPPSSPPAELTAPLDPQPTCPPPSPHRLTSAPLPPQPSPTIASPPTLSPYLTSEPGEPAPVDRNSQPVSRPHPAPRHPSTQACVCPDPLFVRSEHIYPLFVGKYKRRRANPLARCELYGVIPVRPAAITSHSEALANDQKGQCGPAETEKTKKVGVVNRDAEVFMMLSDIGPRSPRPVAVERPPEKPPNDSSAAFQYTPPLSPRSDSTLGATPPETGAPAPHVEFLIKHVDVCDEDDDFDMDGDLGYPQ